MPDYSDPKRAVAYRFTLSLFARSGNQIKTVPTLAAGDVKVSKDNGATANITTLPAETPASSGILQVDLSATEMTADLVTVIFRDAAGAEWNDVAIHLAPAVRQMADLAFPNTSGRGMDIDASGGVEVGSFQTGAITAAAYAAGAIDAAALAADAGTEIAAAVWDRVLSGATHNIASSAGRRLRQLDAASITDGTAQAGASNSITLAAGASATNEIYDENLIVITEGTGAGQTRVIVEYNGTSKVAIVNRTWEVTPDNTSVYEVIASAQADIAQHGLAQAGAASSITLASTASAVNDVYVGAHVYLSTSTGSGQTRLITAYNGTTKVATVSPAWVTNPGANTVYKIIPVGRSIVESLGVQAKADIQAEATSALNAYDPPTNAEMVTRTLAAADYATAAALTVVDDFLDTEVAAILAAVDTEVAAIKAKTDLIPAAPAAVGDIPTAAFIADAVWDEATAGHTTAGTTGKALTDAGSAGDPWATVLPGAYGAGTAGKLVGDNINAPIATVDTVVDAIKAKTDSLTFTVAGQVDANIQYVNDVQVNGTGATGNEWGP